MKKKDYSFLFTSKAVNRSAASVLSGGEHYNSQRIVNQLHSEIPIITTDFPGPKEHDMTGVRFGRFVVTGYYKGKRSVSGKRQYGLWVVRCDCGHYETRKTPSIKNPSNANDMCEYCREVENFKTAHKRMA